MRSEYIYEMIGTMSNSDDVLSKCQVDIRVGGFHDF